MSFRLYKVKHSKEVVDWSLLQYSIQQIQQNYYLKCGLFGGKTKRFKILYINGELIDLTTI